MIVREVSPDELAELLGPVQWMITKTEAARAIVDGIEQGVRVPTGVAFYADTDRIEVFARDELEAELGAGGMAIAELDTDRPVGRCITCGQPAADWRPWCSVRCRRLLRDHARKLFPEDLDSDAIDKAIRWATWERNTRLGWRLPLL